MPDMLAPFDCSLAIRGLIDQVGLKQSYIAKKIGITQGRVSQLYNGTDAKGMLYESRYKLFQLCRKHHVRIIEQVEEV